MAEPTKELSLEEQIIAHNEQYAAYTPLMLAAANGRMEDIISICTSDSVEINQIGGWNDTTALMLACQNGYVDIVKYLLDKKADIHVRNSATETALMLAANEGFLEIIQELVAAGADVFQVDQLKMNAVMKAAKANHVEIVEWLCESYIGKNNDLEIDQLSVFNVDGKTALMIAAELGHLETASWIIDHRPYTMNITSDKKGFSVLMFACSGSSARHQYIADLLIQRGVDVNHKTLSHWTALMFTAKGGIRSITERLIAKAVDLDVINMLGQTAIGMAVEAGRIEVVKLLLNAGAKREDIELLKLSLDQGYIEIALEFFKVLGGDNNGLLSFAKLYPSSVSYGLLISKFSESHVDALHTLAIYAAKYDFFFDMFLQLIQRLPTPTLIINKNLTLLFDGLKSPQRTTDVDLLHKLVLIAASLKMSALSHPLERLDLEQRYETIMNMLEECVNTDCLDSEVVLNAVLSYKVALRQKLQYEDALVEAAQAFLVGPLQAAVQFSVKGFFCGSHIAAYLDSIFWGFLRKSKIDHTKRYPFKVFLETYLLANHRVSEESKHILTLKSDLIHARYAPFIMFFLEGFSKLIIFALICYISIAVIVLNETYNAYSPPEMFLFFCCAAMVFYEYGQYREVELMTRSHHSVYFSFKKYITDVWNALDCVGLAFIVIWVISKSLGAPNQVSQAVLSTAAIPFSVGLLRYVSMYEPVGKLVILLFAMMANLGPFGVVFIFVLIGFSAAMYATNMGQGVSSFDSGVQTALTLFSTSLNNYDGTFTDTFGINLLGAWSIWMQIVFIIFYSIVLLNVLIARMSATHQKIDVKSYEEWQFSNADSVMHFLLLKERHPFCMLPPPFNLLPFFASFANLSVFASLRGEGKHSSDGHGQRSPSVSSVSSSSSSSSMVKYLLHPFGHSKVHEAGGSLLGKPGFSFNLSSLQLDLQRKQKSQSKRQLLQRLRPRQMHPRRLSIPGTVSDITIGLVMAFLAPFYEFLRYFYLLIMHHHSKVSLIEICFILAIYPFLLLPYVIHLVGYVLQKSRTHLIDLKVDKEVMTLVEYERRKFYTPVVSPNDDELMNFQVQNCFKLPCSKKGSNPLVKVRIGEMELITKPSIYGGNEPVWIAETLQFPLNGLVFADTCCTLEVVDRDPITGIENVVSSFSAWPIKITSWIANKGFAGDLNFDGPDSGSIKIAVNIIFPTFLNTFSLPSTSQKGGGGAGGGSNAPNPFKLQANLLRLKFRAMAQQQGDQRVAQKLLDLQKKKHERIAQKEGGDFMMGGNQQLVENHSRRKVRTNEEGLEEGEGGEEEEQSGVDGEVYGFESGKSKQAATRTSEEQEAEDEKNEECDVITDLPGSSPTSPKAVSHRLHLPATSAASRKKAAVAASSKHYQQEGEEAGTAAAGSSVNGLHIFSANEIELIFSHARPNNQRMMMAATRGSNLFASFAMNGGGSMMMPSGLNSQASRVGGGGGGSFAQAPTKKMSAVLRKVMQG